MTISKKLSVLIVGFLLLFSVTLLAFTSIFINSFYKYKRRETIRDVYEVVYEEVETYGMVDSVINEEIKDIAIENVVKIACFDEDGESLSNDKSLSAYGVVIDKVTLENANDYSLYIPTEGEFFVYNETNIKNELLKNIGFVGKIVSPNNDSLILGYVIIYTPEKAIESNTSIFTSFILYETFIFLILAFVLAFIVANRFAKPLKDIEAKTKRIANLDFSNKLNITSQDEIGSLSVSINKMSDKLESSINELREANMKLEKDLELESQINVMRQNFISDVSHELKTPISIIAGYSEALKLEGSTQEEINEYSDIIIDETKKMNKMVRELIKYAQIQSGLVDFEKEDFNVKDLIDGIINPYGLEIKERQIDLKEEVEDINVNGDYDMLSIVFSNLFSNAMHYVDENRKIEVKTEIINDKVKVSVRNTGVNIKDEEKDKIWDSFYKVDKARTRRYGGSGLGLSIVKTIMVAYKNDYGFINTTDGVEFFFYINRSSEE